MSDPIDGVVAPEASRDGVTAEVMPGSVGLTAQQRTNFPYDAFEMEDSHGGYTPILDVVSPWTFRANRRSNVLSKAGDYTILDTDGDLLVVSDTATITLPTLADNLGRTFIIVNTHASNTVTVDGEGAETVNGAANATVVGQYFMRGFYADPNEWLASGLVAIPVAVDIAITDAGAYYTGTEVEAALQEIGASIGGLGTALKTITATEGLAAGDKIVVCNNTTDIVVTLTAAATKGAGEGNIIKRINTGGVLVEGNGSETIDGVLNWELFQYDSMQVVSDASNYHIE